MIFLLRDRMNNPSRIGSTGVIYSRVPHRSAYDSVKGGSLLAKGSGFRHFVSALVSRERFPEGPELHAGICEGASDNRCPYLNRSTTV